MALFVAYMMPTHSSDDDDDDDDNNDDEDGDDDVMFKTRAGSFLNGFKNIPGKVCVNRVYNNDAFVNVGN